MAAVQYKLDCTATAVPARILVCDLAFDAAGLCTGAQVVLPGPANGTCTWMLDGAVIRDAYTLGILDNTGIPQTTSTVCQPSFGVTAFGGIPGMQGPTAALLTVSSGVVTNDVALLIAPISVLSCPPAALDCR